MIFKKVASLEGAYLQDIHIRAVEGSEQCLTHRLLESLKYSEWVCCNGFVPAIPIH